MAAFQSCSDISDTKPFYPKRHLYLKPLLKINISIQLPSLKLVGRSISNITLMENIRNWAAPDKFCTVKVTKSTLEFIRFEADLLNPAKVHAILARLDGKQVQLPGFKEIVKVRASIAKSDFPTRHDWDSFFRDAKHMNEMKAGERPDTLHLSELPNKWFSTKSREDLPSESLIKKIFQQFGEVTAVDIPSIDPYRSKMKAHLSGLKLFNFNQNTTFEAYVQYRDYIAFVKAMDYLRGMKLLRVDTVEAFTTNIKVDFDKTKHLSENSIRKRKIEREKLMAKDRELEEEKQKIEDALKKLEEKEKEKKEITEKETELKKKKEKRKDREDEGNESEKIVNEKKLLLAAQRKLESIRILTDLLRIIKEHKIKKEEDISYNITDDIQKKSKMNENCMEETEKPQEETLRPKRTSEITKLNTEDKSRLHSEVVRVDRSSTDYRKKMNEVHPVYNSNGHHSNRRGRWRRGGQRWTNSNVNGERGGIRHYVSQNRDYYRNTQHLYYKYFQSLTRSGDPGPSRSKSNSRSRSQSSNSNSPLSEFDTSRSKFSPKIHSKRRNSSSSRSRSRSYNEIDLRRRR